MPTKNPAGNIVDIAAKVSDLDAYWFLGTAGAVTITGFFVDANGHRARKADGTLSPSFTGTILVAGAGNNPRNFATLAGLTGTVAANYPNVVGWIGTLSAAVYMDIQDTGAVDNDFKTGFANYPQLTAGTLKTLARVA